MKQNCCQHALELIVVEVLFSCRKWQIVQYTRNGSSKTSCQSYSNPYAKATQVLQENLTDSPQGHLTWHILPSKTTVLFDILQKMWLVLDRFFRNHTFFRNIF